MVESHSVSGVFRLYFTQWRRSVPMQRLAVPITLPPEGACLTSSADTVTAAILSKSITIIIYDAGTVLCAGCTIGSAERWSSN